MSEINVQAEIIERVSDFKEVFAEVTSENPAEINFDDLADAILTIGLNQMMVDFFRRLDDGTLQKSIDQFYQAYPHLQRVEPIGHCDNHLVNIHAELSLRYPKPFFQFMLERLKSPQWAKARERLERLFEQPIPVTGKQ